jgi:GGDEF domain-containing protein
LFKTHKDKKGKYYFLLDSETNADDKTEIHQPFELLSSNWDESHSLKSTTKFSHYQDNNLWVTVAVPIVQQNLESIISPDKNLLFAKRLHECISITSIKVDDLSLPVTISIGVNPFGGRYDSFREAVAEADKALYRAKESGRNKICVSGID